MIESNIPDVDVNDLLKQVRAEADRLSDLAMRPGNESANAGTVLRNVRSLRPSPRMAVPLQPDFGADQLKKLHDLLERARQAAELTPRIPKWFRKWFRKQDEYNALLIQSVIPLFESVSKQIAWSQEVSPGLYKQTNWLADLGRVRAEENEWMKTAGNKIHALTQELERLEAATKALESEKIDSLQRAMGSVQQAIGSIHQNLASTRKELSFLEEHYSSDASFIKSELALRSAFMQRWFEGSPTSGKKPPSSKVAPADFADRPLDAFYFSFENRFRGNREEIKKRARFYLPFLEKAGAGNSSKPIVDLGCGRGEWLELLGEQGLQATGVDLNETMIAQCQQRKLNVVHADALKFLRDLPDRSQGAVTGFHIIEHLPLQILVSLLAETFRVLQPGGLAFFETPNCKNLIVGATNFNIDPTHRRPIHPETAQFMLETQGFERVTLEYLSPIPIDPKYRESLPTPVGELLWGPQDFSVIGYKSASN